MRDEFRYLDPAIVARFEDITVRHRAAMAQLAEDHEREVAEVSRANAEREQRNKEFMEKLSAAVDRRTQAREAEPQNRWPERERKDRVLSFGDRDEPPAPAPQPAPPPPPQPKPVPKVEPKPAATERPSKGRVLNFSTEDDEDEGFQGFRRRR